MLVCMAYFFPKFPWGRVYYEYYKPKLCKHALSKVNKIVPKTLSFSFPFLLLSPVGPSVWEEIANKQRNQEL